MKPKNDSRDIQNLIFGDTPPLKTTKVNTRFSSGIRAGAHSIKPPPFMTDPEFDEPEKEKVLIQNIISVEDRIEQKLKEIDNMMIVEIPDPEPKVEKVEKPMTTEQRRAEAAKAFMAKQKQQEKKLPPSA